jgi:hypothetical protein
MKYVILLFIVIAAHCYGAPRLEIETEVIRGVVSDWVWIDTTLLRKEWDGSSIEQTISAHYLIILSGVDGISKETRRKISEYSRAGFFPDEIMDRKLTEDQILIIITTPKRDDIKTYQRLELKGYCIFADDFGAQAKLKSIAKLSSLPIQK